MRNNQNNTQIDQKALQEVLRAYKSIIEQSRQEKQSIQSDIRKTRDDDLKFEDYEAQIKECEKNFGEIKKITEKYVDSNSLQKLNDNNISNNATIQQNPEYKTSFENGQDDIDLLEIEFFKDVDKEKNTVNKTDDLDIFFIDTNNTQKEPAPTIPHTDTLGYSIGQPNPVVDKQSFFNPVRPFVGGFNRDSDTDDVTMNDITNQEDLNESETDMLKKYLNFKDLAQQIGACILDDVNTLQEENMKLQQKLFIYEIDQNHPQQCRRCGKTFMKSNKEDKCNYHPGDLRFFSCIGCGGDEYLNCCRKCINCSPGCKVGNHVPIPRAYAEIAKD